MHYYIDMITQDTGVGDVKIFLRRQRWQKESGKESSRKTGYQKNHKQMAKLGRGKCGARVLPF